MARTIGAKDKKPRKKRKFYAGKPIKRKKKSDNFAPYFPRRKPGDPIKIWFWKQQDMSIEGLKNWSPKLRAKVSKKIYKPYIRADVEEEAISSKEAVEQTAIDILGEEGIFIMKGFSHGKNKRGVKNVPMAVIRIRLQRDGLRATMIKNVRLYRYKFYKKK